MSKPMFKSQVLNASTLAWISSVGPEKLSSQLFPMHVWLSFMQKHQVNVGGQLLSLLDMEHNMLRAQSKAPKFGWIFQQKGRSERAFRHLSIGFHSAVDGFCGVVVAFFTVFGECRGTFWLPQASSATSRLPWRWTAGRPQLGVSTLGRECGSGSELGHLLPPALRLPEATGLLSAGPAR